MGKRMEGSPTVARGPVSIMKEAEGICDEFKRRRTNALGLPVDIETAARPMFFREDWNPFLQETAIEISIVAMTRTTRPSKSVMAVSSMR